jgi:acyl-CoA thioesterase YciA
LSGESSNVLAGAGATLAPPGHAACALAWRFARTISMLSQSALWQAPLIVAEQVNTPTMSTPLLPQKTCALRVVPQPSDANVHGDVFGGWIMAQVDIAGSIPASRRANGRVATVAVNSFIFKQPVFVGDLLSFYADIVKTGTTSITVSVEVFAQRMSLTEELVKVTEATLTYVATDKDRRPRKLPELK